MGLQDICSCISAHSRSLCPLEEEVNCLHLNVQFFIVVLQTLASCTSLNGQMAIYILRENQTVNIAVWRTVQHSANELWPGVYDVCK